MYPQPEEPLAQSAQPPIDLRPSSADTLETLKRKRSRSPRASPLFESFVAETALPDGKPCTKLTPYIRILRSALPLSYIDYGATSSNLSVPLVFTTKTSALHGFIEEQSKPLGPIVIIAQRDNETQCFAIEKVSRTKCLLCPLAVWISLADLRALPTPQISELPVAAQSIPAQQNPQSWWKPIALEVVHHEPCSEVQHPHTNLIAHDSLGGSSIVPTTTLAAEQHQQVSPTPVVPKASESTGVVVTEGESPRTIEALCCTVVEQYLDILYKSKASVAYFAKGPLSRARANLPLLGDGNTNAMTYADAMRSMIIGPARLDKKYRIRIPELLRSAGAEEQASTSALGRSKRAKKLRKPVPSKDGLYNIEADLVDSWYHNNEPADGTAKGSSPWKQQLLVLQFREYLLQIVLILETMAIEASISPDLASTPSATTVTQQTSISTERQMKSQSVPKKTKAPQDLTSTLDMLVEKLCIWQSVGLSESSEVGPQSDDKQPTSNDPSDRERGNDRIKDFYVDVLIPFYSSRLPKKTMALCKALGVSLTVSPTKVNIGSKQGTKRLVPGTEIQRSRPQQRREPLARVQRETSFNLRPPSLLRSATDSRLQDIKQGKSLTPENVPSKPSRVPLSRTNSLNAANKHSQREINMSAISKFHDTKAKRKIATEQELKDAIAVLKKPNRGMAVKEYIRTLENVDIDRYTGRPSRTKSGVVIGVTPRKEHRTQDHFYNEVLPPARGLRQDVEHLIPSTNSFIPSSTTKPAAKKQDDPWDSAQFEIGLRNLALPFETPSRGHGKWIDVFHQQGFAQAESGQSGDFVPQSTVKTRASASASKQGATPSKAPFSIHQLQQCADSNETMNIGQATTKALSRHEREPYSAGPVDVSGKYRCAPAASSIYETLGWVDDDLDELT